MPISLPKEKPVKPEGSPLFPHASGRWAKKIRGRMVYFGSWADGHDAALARFQEQKDDLYAGRRPRQQNDEPTVKDVCNAYLSHQEQKLKNKELSLSAWNGCHAACLLIVETFGKDRLASDLEPSDFTRLRQKMFKRWRPSTLTKMVTTVKGVFRFADQTDLIERPPKYGPGFTGASQRDLRLARAAKGERFFSPEQLHQILAAADVQLRAAVLLGVNCGFGNADCGRLPLSALDLERGWVNFPRPKTGINRRCPLWPETVAALREAIANRPAPKHTRHGDLVFLTYDGRPCHTDKTTSSGPLGERFSKLLKTLGIKGTLYDLRHTFRTVADNARDQTAIDQIMGHVDRTMGAHYRERVDDSRLLAVTDLVHRWLFGNGSQIAQNSPGTPNVPQDNQPSDKP
jgi:integrase